MIYNIEHFFLILFLIIIIGCILKSLIGKKKYVRKLIYRHFSIEYVYNDFGQQIYIVPQTELASRVWDVYNFRDIDDLESFDDAKVQVDNAWKNSGY